jgi:hypothetical protein
VINFNLHGYDQNPVAMIRAAMAACPDEAPTQATTGLSFIIDADLRASIRLDISAADRNYAEGEWKGATVLAGAAVEALLLWVLQEHEQQHPGARQQAIDALRGSGTLTRQPDTNLERWNLHEYAEVVAQLQLIERETATLVRLARDFRNLIHPGRSARLRQKCDRSTALTALAAVEAVARDLRP